jgi:hypothetical protein
MAESLRSRVVVPVANLDDAIATDAAAILSGSFSAERVEQTERPAIFVPGDGEDE